MFQVQSNWHGELDEAANVKFDPDGDGKFPMIDTDSDGDGIPDSKEVLWSVDSDGDNRINLVDWDSDGDGLCDGWCTSDSTSAWRTSPEVAGWTVTLPPGMPNGEDTNQNGTNDQNESSPIKPDTDGDGLWDGYTSIWNSTTHAPDWLFNGIDSQRCPTVADDQNFCGEGSTYSLYINATAWTSPTNRTNPDTDAYENPAG
jgi:hypothetical protein